MKLMPKKTKDFGYLEIHDLYTEDELNDIWKEIFFLDYVMDLPKFRKERGESSANHDDGSPKMNGSGIFLDGLYAEREFSMILKHNRKLFSYEVIESVGKSHPANKVAYSMVNKDTTLLNKYRNSQEYAPHHDLASFTGLTVLMHQPEKIRGGEFSFPDYKINFGARHNSCVIFPSWVDHAVSKLHCFGDSRRYSIAQPMFILGSEGRKQLEQNQQKEIVNG
jgi:hypothetical protein